MMRMAGLAMIMLGLIGLGLAAFDWDRMFESTEDIQTASDDGVETEQETAGVEQEPGNQTQDEAIEVVAAASEEPAPAPADARPAAPEIVQPSEEPAPDANVSESDPANVKVFERDAQPDQSTPTLWAEISAGSDTVNEDSGHASFLVTLSEPSDRSVVIIFSTVDLSANDREDYESQRGTVTFEPGVVSAEIRTPLVDDDIKEDDEQFAIVLNGAPGIVSFKSRRITTTIKDDD